MRWTLIIWLLLRPTDHILRQGKAKTKLEWLSYLKSHLLDLHFLEVISDTVMLSALQLLFHSTHPPFYISMLWEDCLHGPWEWVSVLWLLLGSVRGCCQIATGWRQNNEVIVIILTSLLPKFISCLLFLSKLLTPYDFCQDLVSSSFLWNGRHNSRQLLNLGILKQTHVLLYTSVGSSFIYIPFQWFILMVPSQQPVFSHLLETCLIQLKKKPKKDEKMADSKFRS